VRFESQSEQNDEIPADYADIKQVHHPDESFYEDGNSHGNQFAYEHTVEAPELQCQPCDQRIDFERASVKSGEGGQQIQHLQRAEGPPGTKEFPRYDLPLRLRLPGHSRRRIHEWFSLQRKQTIGIVEQQSLSTSWKVQREAARRMPSRILNATGVPAICAGDVADPQYGQFFGNNNRNVSCA